MQIAPNQKQELDLLQESLKQLERSAGRENKSGIRALQQDLDNWAAKIAVIGQVKAGKSTFLNAFLNQHDFLPSDINPWTSVVTNIRINIESDPVSGARFDFFSEQDWDEIINGKAKVRELTEQHLPGFDSDILKRQTQEMKERAQRRLGKYYHTLLGNSHDYDFLSPELLQRYVCAGPGSDADLEERAATGRYAAITREANVFMRLPEFQVPVVVTDTPGVNDPFLVRDEFTCRSLDKSDVFIVVLSAHQALTSVDIALVKILAEQDTKDVVIFVNRIDELDNYSTHVPRVIADVQARMAAAIPDMNFTVVAGSAFMADTATRPGDEAQKLRDQMDTEQLADYLRESYGEVPEEQIDRLLLASGVGAVKKTLSDVIDSGVGCQKIKQIHEDTRAEIGAIQFKSKRERQSIQLQVENVGNLQIGNAFDGLEKEIARFTGIQSELDEMLDKSNGMIETQISSAWTGLETRLNDVITGFSTSQGDMIRDFIDQAGRNKKDNMISVDLLPLRQDMDRAIQESFNESRANIDQTLSHSLEECNRMISAEFDEVTEQVSMAELPYDQFASTLTFSKKALSFELVPTRGWAFWKRRNFSVEKSVDALQNLISADLRQPVEKILSAFNEAQVERASAGQSRVRVLSRMIDNSVTERVQRLKRDRRQLEDANADPARLEQMVHRLQSQLEVLETRLQQVSVIDSQLSRDSYAKAA